MYPRGTCFQCVAEYFTEKAGNSYGVMSIDFSKSGSILFAGMDNGNVIGWDVPAGTEVGKSGYETEITKIRARDKQRARDKIGGMASIGI